MDRKRPGFTSPPVKSKTIDSFFKTTPKRQGSENDTPAGKPPEAKRQKLDESSERPTKVEKKLPRREGKRLNLGAPLAKSQSGLSNSSADSSESGPEINLLDVVWAKLEGHPWWPGLIVESDEKDYAWEKKSQVHVVFYSRPVTWAWVKKKFVEPFDGKSTSQQKNSKYYCAGDKEWSWGVEYATKAIGLPKNEREEHIGLTDEDTFAAKKNKDKAATLVSDIEEDSEEDSVEDDKDDSFKPEKAVETSDSENEMPSPSPSPSPRVKKSSVKISASTPVTPKTPKADVSMRARAALASFAAPEDDADGTKFEHNGYTFLQDKNRRDINGKLHSDPDSDQKTLLVPKDFLKKCTAALQQWWKLKAENYDTILLFKMGKFYELYHQDAVVATKELNLKYMGSAGGKNVAHCGFPEISYARYAEQLVERGYKVARVEQTETPQMMEERNRQTKSKDKVVRRELCRVTTAGTKTFSFIDGDNGSTQPGYLLAICELGRSRGICFVDTSTGHMEIGQFEDDEQNSRLRTLLAHFPPAEVLCERGKISNGTKALLFSVLRATRCEQLLPNSQFWSAKDTLAHLTESQYFSPEEDEAKAQNTGRRSQDLYPEALKLMLDDKDVLGLTAKSEYQLAIRSLGAIIWYLKECLIDHDVMSLKKLEEYKPLDSGEAKVIDGNALQKIEFAKHMVIDAVSIHNLDILRSSAGGSYTTEGTLYRCLDYCQTPFGKRLLYQWICAPLCDPTAISQRQDAVANLLDMTEFAKKAVEILKKIPDVERLMQKIHTCGSLKRSQSHPDSRAVLFDAEIYTKRKIDDFLKTIEGLKCAVRMTQLFQEYEADVTSTLLTRCLSIKDVKNRVFPAIEKELDHFDKAFDHAKAKKDGVIIPERGVDSEFDQCQDLLAEAEKNLDKYLEEQKKKFGSKAICYFGTGKNRYQLELPESVASKVGDEYMFQSQRKGFKRYRTPVLEKLLSELEKCEQKKDVLLADIARKIFAKFAAGHKKFKMAIDCLSVFDVLMSFARYAASVSHAICRPEIVKSEKPFIEIKNGVYPCLSKTFNNEDFIPNDCAIGTEDNPVILLTGPNMGGKSTLMRQMSLTVIMAQLGSFVPAESCRLTPVDRIFTRIGASDRISAGQSTFYVELSECGSILRYATRHSLVIMDELGRGTATHDGTAIAASVVKYMAERIQCRTLFSTHYHSLVAAFKDHSNMSLGHMACMVENENEDDPTEETITFLYKFRPGSCPKSYGFHVAKLAGVPTEVVRRASHKSRDFASKQTGSVVLRRLDPTDMAKVKEMRDYLKNLQI